MASLTSVGAKAFHKHAIDGLQFADVAIQFAALGWEAEKNGLIKPRLHRYALAIEVAFKSLALRSGATLDECKKTGHYISKQIELVQKHGVLVPETLKKRLSDDKWFRKMLFMTRYPEMLRAPMTFENTLFFHSNYPEMIAAILEIPCDAPLGFEKGSALDEIENKLQYSN